MHDEKTQAHAARAMLELQWLCQDLERGWLEQTMAMRRSLICSSLDYLIDRADGETLRNRLRDLRSRIVTIRRTAPARRVLKSLTEVLDKEWSQDDTDRNDRQTRLKNEG